MWKDRWWTCSRNCSTMKEQSVYGQGKGGVSWSKEMRRARAKAAWQGEEWRCERGKAASHGADRPAYPAGHRHDLHSAVGAAAAASAEEGRDNNGGRQRQRRNRHHSTHSTQQRPAAVNSHCARSVPRRNNEGGRREKDAISIVQKAKSSSQSAPLSWKRTACGRGLTVRGRPARRPGCRPRPRRRRLA